MLNVSAKVKAAFKSESATRSISVAFPDLGVTLSNSQIEKDSIEMVEAIEGEKYLNFTGLKSSRFEFTCQDMQTDIRGASVSVTISAGATTPVPLFNGYVYSVSNENHEDRKTKVICYDLLNKKNAVDVAEWYNGLTFPLTVKALRDSLALYLGLTQEETTLPFDTFQIDKTIDPDEMSAKDVLVCICQANGVYARINRSGNLEYMKLATSKPQEITADEYESAEYENYTTAVIDRVQIRTDEDDIGGVYGTGTNCYVIENNFLFFGQTEDSLASIAQTVYGLVSGYSYKPFELNLNGMPYMEPGDYIKFTTRNNTVTIYIFRRTLSGLPQLKDNFSADGSKERSSQINSVNSQITQLKGRANRLTRTVAETNSRIDDVESGLESEIKQTSDEIELKISDLQSQIDGSINVYNREGEPTLLNYPAWDFTYNIPCNNTVQTTNNLKFVYTSDYYKKNQRALCYDETGGASYRFRKDDNGTYFWEVVQDTEYSVLLSRITALEVSDGEIKASIQETDQTVSGHTTSITKLSSSITQNANSIKAEVTRASDAEKTITGNLELKISNDDNDQIVSMLNASANVITLKSNRLEISSDHFTLKKDGTITATNGTFTGKVTATSGSFTGKVTATSGSFTGTVNATDGSFTGKVTATSGSFTGTVNATSGSFNGTITANSGTIGGLSISDGGISKTASGYTTAYQSDGTLVCYDANNNVKWALQSNGGAQFNGNVTINGYTTTAQLTAVSGRVGDLEADHVTTKQLDATKASINDLSAIAITTNNFSAQKINANNITSGTISADRISADTITAKLVGATVNVYAVYATTGFTYQGHPIVFQPARTAYANNYNVLCYK